MHTVHSPQLRCGYARDAILRKLLYRDNAKASSVTEFGVWIRLNAECSMAVSNPRIISSRTIIDIKTGLDQSVNQPSVLLC